MKQAGEPLVAENVLCTLIRLDRLVSGVLLLARSSAVASAVCNLILQCKVTKEYIARVKGIFPAGRVEVCDPITVLEEEPLICGISPQGPFILHSLYGDVAT